LAERFQLAEVNAMSRPFLDHTLLVWCSNENVRFSSYFKLATSWLLEPQLKEMITQEWNARQIFRSTTKVFAEKLMRTRSKLISFKMEVWERREKSCVEALQCVDSLDKLEDKGI
jgi:6-pyruvoyl-tetrahydropterin synthase